jgi:hypothetical protein
MIPVSTGLLTMLRELLIVAIDEADTQPDVRRNVLRIWRATHPPTAMKITQNGVPLNTCIFTTPRVYV